MMVRPIEVQSFIVSAVASTQDVSQAINHPNVLQHLSTLELVQKTQQEDRMVNASKNMEQKNVRNPTEGGQGGGGYIPFRRHRSGNNFESERKLSDDKRGLILDVRT